MAPPRLPISEAAAAASRRDLLRLGAGFGVAAAAGSVALAADPAPATTTETCCPLVELRQYTLRPGHREAFNALFEREFIDPMEADGIKVIGQFRDLDDPDRFVWLRGFPDMPARATSLGGFYGSPIWKSHRDEANSSINDSDNVLLLHPAWEGSGFPASRLHREASAAKAGAASHDRGVIMAWLHYVDADNLAAFTDFFRGTMKPKIEALGIPVLAAFGSETRENNFKGLPVREHDRVVVWFSRFPDIAACDHAIASLRQAQGWREGASDPMLHQLARKPEILRLSPMTRSALRA